MDEIALALDKLKVQTVQECTIQDTRCVLPEVGNLMEQYTDIAAGIDQILNQELPQMELYFEFGGLLDSQQETSSVTAAAKYLAEQYTDLHGFSPRSLRRMRAFYRTYKDQPSILNKAMSIGWTQNIVIFEACLTEAEREWYILAVRKFGWSKLVLIREITEKAHLNSASTESTVSDAPDSYASASLPRTNGQHVESTGKMQDTGGFRLHPRPLLPAASEIRRLDLKQAAHLYFPKAKAGSIFMPVIRPIKDMGDIQQIAHLCRKTNEPVFLTKNGYANLVVMSMETYEQKMKVLNVYHKLSAF